MRKAKSYTYAGWIASLLFFLVGVTPSCQHGKITGTAVVVFEAEEGGFYVLQDERGERYHPLNLAESYHFNDLRVYVEALLRPDTVLTPQRGIPVEIMTIKPLLLSTTATVERVDSLGTSFRLVDAYGQHYAPLNLDPLFAVDQLPVHFDARLRPDTSAGAAWGLPIQLIALTPALAKNEQVGIGQVRKEETEADPAYVIVDLKGQRFVPLNLPPSFQHDALPLRFGYAIAADADSAAADSIALNYVGRADSQTDFAGRGMIRRLSPEEGALGIVAENGRRFLPLNLTDGFQQDGLLVRFWGVTDSSAVSTGMWGMPVRLNHVDLEEPARRYSTGTVQYLDLEGGFYGLVDETGGRYNPLNLPEEYQQDGLRVFFSFVPRIGVMSIRMWGEPVDLLYIGPRH